MRPGSLLWYKGSDNFAGTVTLRFCIHWMEQDAWVDAVVKLHPTELVVLLGLCPQSVQESVMRYHILTSHGIICVSNTNFHEHFRVLK